MTIRSRFLSLICVTAGLAVAHAYAADAPAPAAENTAAPAAGHQWHGGHRHHRSELHRVLGQLNLTPEQKTQIKSIVAQAKGEFSARHASSRADREALLAMAPDERGYPALLATEKANAAARIQSASDIKTQIYAVLRPDQQSRIPTIIAADRAARDARVAAWRSQHAS